MVLVGDQCLLQTVIRACCCSCCYYKAVLLVLLIMLTSAASVNLMVLLQSWLWLILHTVQVHIAECTSIARIFCWWHRMHIYLSFGKLVEHFCNNLEKAILWRQQTTPASIVLLHTSLP